MTTLTPPNRHISRSRLIAGRSRPHNQGQERNDEGRFEEGHQQDVRFDIFVRQEVARGIVEPGRKGADPVDVNATSVADSVRVDLTGFMSVKSKANGPGEISAPAVRLGSRLTNTGAKSIALTSVVVNAHREPVADSPHRGLRRLGRLARAQSRSHPSNSLSQTPHVQQSIAQATSATHETSSSTTSPYRARTGSHPEGHEMNRRMVLRRSRPVLSRGTALRVVAGLAGLAMSAVGLFAVTAPVALADSLPTSPGTPATVTGDPLPTVQINGVAWSQVVVETTVYVAGSFANARPAGAAAGVNTTPRSNLLAYDITTGNLITTWAPTVNAQALSIAASPDGSTIYVGGGFTQDNGQVRSRIAAFTASTGAWSRTSSRSLRPPCDR